MYIFSHQIRSFSTLFTNTTHMKKLLIAAAVGSIILFFWQFLSWSLLGIHTSQMAYTDKQDVILEALDNAGVQEGHYFLPTVPAGTSFEEETANQEKMAGKPWARVSYHKSFEVNMGMNMFRGWLISFVSVFLLAWMLVKMADLNFQTALLSSLAVGLIGYFTIMYQQSIWFETNSIPHLVDAVVQWGIAGSWLGWYLPKNNT